LLFSISDSSFSQTKITALFLAATFALTGCFGEYALVRKVYKWHSAIGDDDSLGGRFLRQLVVWVLVPFTFGIAGFLDSVIFNLIEFWSGSNPMAMAEGEYEYQMVYHEGKAFKMTATKNKFMIEELGNTESLVNFKYDEGSKTWSIETVDMSAEMMTYKEDGTIE